MERRSQSNGGTGYEIWNILIGGAIPKVGKILGGEKVRSRKHNTVREETFGAVGGGRKGPVSFFGEWREFIPVQRKAAGRTLRRTETFS